MAKKIAIPVTGNALETHFGKAKNFHIITVDGNGTVLAKEVLTPPPHEPGVIPAWLKELNVNTIIAGGMGGRALSLFQEYGIQVCSGVEGRSSEELVEMYCQGKLAQGIDACKH